MSLSTMRQSTMSPSTSMPSLPITGVFVHPNLSTTDTIDCLRDNVAIQVSKCFNLDPVIKGRDLEISETVNMLVFQANKKHEDRILASITHQEAITEENNNLRDSLRGQLTKTPPPKRSHRSAPAADANLEEAIRALQNGLQREIDARKKESAAFKEESAAFKEESAAHAKKITELEQLLKQEKGERDQDVKVLKKLITPLHLRILLDAARGKILQVVDCKNWEDLSRAHQNPANHIHTKLQTAFPDPSQNCPSKEALEYLCFPNNIRRSGNQAAHHADLEDIQTAVGTKRIGSKERKALDQLFSFTYDQSA